MSAMLLEEISHHKKTLFHVARQSIEHGLTYASAPQTDAQDYSPLLREKAATFVTLHLDGALRGCIGHLEATQPLIVDISSNAYAAAFHDFRFTKVSRAEYPQLAIGISILSKPEPLRVANEDELRHVLRPGVDGLIVQRANQRGTFLPSVWEQLPDPADFLRHLKRKAAINEHTRDGIEYFRYQTICLEE